MKIIFIALLIIYYSLDIFILSQLFNNKNRINFKREITSFLFASILLLSIYFLKINIPYIVLIFYIIALKISAFFGNYLDYFNKLNHFDRYLHSYDSFAFSLLFYFIIINFIRSGGSKIFRSLFIVFLGISIGAIFEIIEFIIDTHKKEESQRAKMQKGLKDTDFDLICDIIGSALGSIFAYFMYL